MGCIARRAVLLSAHHESSHRDGGMSEESRLVRWVMDPLRGKTTLGRVIGWYGIVGSLVYSALGAGLNVENERAMQAYTVGGLIFSIYVTVATYRCAASLHSSFTRGLVRVSALLSLALLPLLAYLALSGAFTLTSLGGIE
jgi:hypothetical protein